jgi:hypothetical protein
MYKILLQPNYESNTEEFNLLFFEVLRRLTRLKWTARLHCHFNPLDIMNEVLQWQRGLGQNTAKEAARQHVYDL